MKTMSLILFLMMICMIMTSETVYAHCDSEDGPVMKDARKALETNNVNLVMKWIDQKDEKEIADLFNKTYALRNGDKEVYQIVEKHFLETLVRLHRESEGEPFTGLKPEGSASAIAVMADLALANQDLEDLLKKLDNHINSFITAKYNKARELEPTRDESVEKGREYVSAYVDYVHSLEAIHLILEGASHHGH